ncbi:MAG: hypothetical protein KGK03_02065 [Candidatus Omnitrophica bacterium]|nr:hypothetical protein [Candidatus Omnitrophota bacterium]MDE2221835.1 hypothetical protein [Candidatus Omnitrophota bacterium]
MRVLFLIISVFLAWAGQARAVEVYVGGHRYDSFQAYRAAQKAVRTALVTAALDEQQEEYKNKVKITRFNEAQAHRLYVLGVENGMKEAAQRFFINPGAAGAPAAQHISSEQLQKALEQAMGKSKGPKLLIAGPGKVRVMALAPNEQAK